jgi:FeS assembly SUF system regulator
MIRMTKAADYGIVLLTRMAVDSERIFSTSELSQDTQLPHPTVSKILKILSRHELLDSHRGAKGGYSLCRAPEEVSVEQIITALDGPIGITECIDDAPGECDQESVCHVRGNWQRINEAIRQALAGITLAEMTAATPDRLVTLGARGQTQSANPN